MYEWRKLTDEERWETLKARRRNKVPHHAPPAAVIEVGFCTVTAACYEHRDVMADSARRRTFLQELLEHLEPVCKRTHAWVVLPNHYHVLIELTKTIALRSYMGKLHGRTSRQWNLADGTPGRKVWYHSIERCIRSPGHYYTSLNYIHHNPVRDGYCRTWLDWECSSARDFLQEVGRDKAIEIWRAYPLKESGKRGEE
jgi:putative transposase